MMLLCFSAGHDYVDVVEVGIWHGQQIRQLASTASL